MGPVDVLLHLLGFAAPALALAAFLVLAGPVLLRRPRRLAWWVQLALNGAVGIAVLALGLWHFGVDGKMATYAGLVVAVALTQWAGSGAWRT